jgi:hypothetical protein
MKRSMLLLLCAYTLNTHSQDSIKTDKPIKIKRHEIGLNILPPFLALTGVSGGNPQYFNITYKYFLNERTAFRTTAGIIVFGNHNIYGNQTETVIKTNSVTINKTKYTQNPTNIQGSIGLERILGKRKLKHVIGFDLTYNYQNQRENISYFKITDSIGINNEKIQMWQNIDTGRVVTNTYFNKYGITPFYSVRYPITEKFILTSSIRFNLQASQRRYNGLTYNSFDFNMSGVISEVSLFYRF